MADPRIAKVLEWFESMDDGDATALIEAHRLLAVLDSLPSAPAQRTSKDFNPEPSVGAPDDRPTVKLRGREWFMSLFDGPRGQRWYLDRPDEVAELAAALQPSAPPGALGLARSKAEGLREAARFIEDTGPVRASVLVAELLKKADEAERSVLLEKGEPEATEEDVERAAVAIAKVQRPTRAFADSHPDDREYARELARAALAALGRGGKP